MRRIAAGLVLTLAVLVAGCTSGPRPGQAAHAAPADFDAWHTAVAAVCDRFEPRMQARLRRLGQPSSLPEAATYFDQMTPINNRYMDAIVAVPTPDTRAADIGRLYSLTEDLRHNAELAQAAAHFSDQASYSHAIDTLDAIGAEANQLLLELNLPGCVSPD